MLYKKKFKKNSPSLQTTPTMESIFSFYSSSERLLSTRFKVFNQGLLLCLTLTSFAVTFLALCLHILDCKFSERFLVIGGVTCSLLVRSSPLEVFLKKRFLEMCSKFTGEYPCRNVVSIKLQSNFIEITVRHMCSPVNFPHIFRTPFPKNISGGLLLIS